MGIAILRLPSPLTRQSGPPTPDVRASSAPTAGTSLSFPSAVLPLPGFSPVRHSLLAIAARTSQATPPKPGADPSAPPPQKSAATFAETSSSDSPFGTKTKMSSSGSNAALNLPPFSSARKNCQCRFPAALQTARKFSATHQRQQFLRRPQRRCRRSRSRTFQTDFAQMQFCRAEIRVRRIVLIQFSHSGSRNRTQPHPYGCKPCLCGSITIESTSAIRAKLSRAFPPRFDASTKYPPYAASTCTRNPNFSRSCNISGNGSTEPVAVVPNVATTVPTSPRATRSASAFTSIRPR